MKIIQSHAGHDPVGTNQTGAKYNSQKRKQKNKTARKGFSFLSNGKTKFALDLLLRSGSKNGGQSHITER